MVVNKKKPSKLWYLLPIFLNIVGGIIGYFAIKDRDKKMAKYVLIVGFIPTIILLLASAITYSIISYSFISSMPSENTTSEWRAALVIVINGEMYPIPADIGYTNKNYAKIYTISTDGILYKSINEDVTLKDFFDTWGKNFNSTCILDYCNTNTKSMVMFVNSKQNSDYEYYIIQNKDVIVIDYR